MRFRGTESELGIGVLGRITWIALSKIREAVLALEVELTLLGITSSALYTTPPSIPPSTLRHSPVMWSAAR